MRTSCVAITTVARRSTSSATAAVIHGFLRLNSAGDADGHVMVTTPEGFQVLDTGLTPGTAELTDAGSIGTRTTTSSC